MVDHVLQNLKVRIDGFVAYTNLLIDYSPGKVGKHPNVPNKSRIKYLVTCSRRGNKNHAYKVRLVLGLLLIG